MDSAELTAIDARFAALVERGTVAAACEVDRHS
jgi:hypothetical protein